MDDQSYSFVNQTPAADEHAERTVVRPARKPWATPYVIKGTLSDAEAATAPTNDGPTAS